MEITIQNYRQLRNLFDSSKLNPAVLEVFNDVDADFEDYLDLYTDASPENDGIRDVLNNHIKLVNKYLVEQPKEAKAPIKVPAETEKIIIDLKETERVNKILDENPKAKTKTLKPKFKVGQIVYNIVLSKRFKVLKVTNDFAIDGNLSYLLENLFSKKEEEWFEDELTLKKPTTTNQQPTTKKPTTKTLKSTISKTFVDNFPIEFQLIKRFWNMVDDGVTVVPFRKVQLLFNAFNKAALERKIRKTNDVADLFTKCSQKITKLYNEFAAPGKKDVEAVLTDRSLYAEIQKYCTNVAVNPAVGVLKRYISIQNTKPDIKKVAVLIKAIDKVLTTDSDNRLLKELRSAKENLEEYIDNPKEYIDVEQFGLSRPKTTTKKVCRNRVKCAGISKNGRLLKGYMFEEDTNHILKVVKRGLGQPTVCRNRVKCKGISKTGRLFKGYKFRPETNEVIYVGTPTKSNAAKKPAAKKKNVASLGYSSEFTDVETITVPSQGVAVDVDGFDPNAYVQNVEQPTPKLEPTPQLAQPIEATATAIAKNKLMAMHFESLEMDNGWENFMQDPAKNMRLAIWGKPKNGKTAGALQFANYLTKFGKVLYNFADQGFNKSTQDLWLSSGLANNAKAEPSDVQTLGELEKEIAKGKYTFVFIDMISDYINREKISPTEFKDRFIKKFPNVSFILIFEVTKGGDFKGDQGWTHIVDAIVTVEDFLMQNRGRYGMGNHVVWDEGFKKFNPKRYAEIMEQTAELEFNQVEQL